MKAGGTAPHLQRSLRNQPAEPDALDERFGLVGGVAVAGAVWNLIHGAEHALLPAALTADAMRIEIGFLRDGCFGRDAAHATGGVLGSWAGACLADLAGTRAGAFLGAQIGGLCAGPAGAISGGVIGSLVGGIGTAIAGSVAGTNFGEYVADRSMPGVLC
jgi:hypothetical protein